MSSPCRAKLADYTLQLSDILSLQAHSVQMYKPLDMKLTAFYRGVTVLALISNGY